MNPTQNSKPTAESVPERAKDGGSNTSRTLDQQKPDLDFHSLSGSESDLDPSSDNDLTQAGEQLARQIRKGKAHPENSTPKKRDKAA